MTFKELWELYINSRPLRAGTVRGYEYKFKKFRDILDVEIVNITALDIQKMYNKVKKDRQQYDYDFVILKAVFNFAVKTNLLDKNPVKLHLKRGSSKKLHELITKQKIIELINYLKNDKKNRKLATMCMTEMLTGARIGEIKAFRKKIIDTNNNNIVIESQYTIVDKEGKQGLAKLKTESATRVLYVPVTLRKNLYSLLDKIGNEDFLFLCKNKPYQTGEVNKYLENVCEKLKIVKLTTHDLRALYATIALYAGINIVTISLQLGHKTIQQTEKYLRRISALDMDSLKKIDSFISINN